MPELEATSEDTRVYETCVLYPFPVSQKEEKDLLTEIEAAFKEAEAVEVSKDKWGRRGLAYTIGGYNEGNYIVFYHEMDPSKLKELDSTLRLIPGLLRHMIVKPPKGYQIEKHSDKYEGWLKERANEIEEKKKEQEDKLKKRMLKKQKPVAKKEAAPAKPAKPADEKKISADIDKIIADDDLEL